MCIRDSIYDPSTAPNGVVRFKEILATFDSRLEQAGIFHRKILELPFSLDHPYWVEDENFDIEYHVRHIALPKPGDWRQLMIQVSRLQSRELDKSRPLWEVYVIEGLNNVGRLPKGCFAVFMKMHHSTIDGVSGAALQSAIHDLKPIQASATDYEPGIRNFADGAPSLANLVARAPLNNLRKAAKLVTGLGAAIPRLVKAKMETRDEESDDIPSTVFNRGRVTANRVIDGCMFELDEVKAIAKSQPETKVNDVALAIVSGALRKYLDAKDDLPVESLIAACPLNVRTDDSQGADNMVSMMNMSLRSDIEEPRKRLNAISAGSRRAKEITEIVGSQTLTTVPLNLPAFIARGLMQPLMSLATRFDAVAFNTMVSNVAGIQQPLYFCGAKMIALYGMGPVVDQAGLFHTVFSYDGKITITFTACREMLPDPDFYADCIRDSYEELRKATLKPKSKPKRKASRRKTSARKASARKTGVKKATIEKATGKKATIRKATIEPKAKDLNDVEQAGA